MTTLKKTSLVILSIFFIISMFFALNVNVGSVFADASLTGGNSSTLQGAIDATEADIETTINLSGEYSISSSITIEDSKKIIFNIVADTIIKRADASVFNLFLIQNLCDVTFKTNGDTKLIFDGQRDENANNGEASIFNVSNSNLKLNGNITIKNNSSSQGAGIYAKGASSKITIENVEFLGNIAKSSASAIYNHGILEIKNCIFKENFGGSNAGVIYTSHNANIINCDFIGNGVKGYSNKLGKRVESGIASTGYVHGGVFVINSGTATIENCNFKNNSADSVKDDAVFGYGGSIDVCGGTLNIVSATFENNSADFGGAIFVQSGTLNVTDMKILNNESLIEGGGFFVNGGVVNISNGTIGNNVSPENKAQDVYFATGSFSSCKFSAKITSSNKYSIYSSQDFCVGENFEIASGSFISLKDGKKIKVQEKLKTKNAILLKVIGKEDSQLVGETLITFKNSSVITENIFVLSNSNYKLVLPQNYTGEPYLFVSIEFTINFYKYPQGEVQDPIKIQGVPYGGSAVPPTETEVGSRDGYAFAGWDKSASELQNITSSLDVYVVWKKIHTVKFYKDYNADTDELIGFISTEQVVDGEGAEAPAQSADWKKDGFQFARWSADFSNVTSDLEIYAIWGEEKTVKFKFKNESGIWQEIASVDSIIVISGARIDSDDLPSIPTKTGYDLSYWALDTTGNTKYVNQIITDNTILYAIYIPNIIEVTFVYENGSTEVVEIDYNKSFTKDIPTIVGKEGYNQNDPYWAYVENDKNGENRFDPSRVIRENFSLYATYMINTYSVDFYMNYYHKLTEDGGKELLKRIKVGSISFEYGDLIYLYPDLPSDPAFTQNSPRWENSTEPVIQEGVSVEGEININVYTIKFEVDGEIYKTYTVEHGKILSEIPNIPEKTGYTQNLPVWSNNDFSVNSNLTSDTKFVAVYTKNVYTVTFVLPDGNRIERRVEHGETVDSINLIKTNFGELVNFDKPLENITDNCEINVSKINLFMWLMIAFGGVLLIIILIIVIKLIKKKKVRSLARKNRKRRVRQAELYITDDD